MENAYFIVKDKVGIFLYFLFKRILTKTIPRVTMYYTIGGIIWIFN